MLLWHLCVSYVPNNIPFLQEGILFKPLVYKPLSGCLTFAFDWPKDAGSDAVDRALAPPAKSKENAQWQTSKPAKIAQYT